MTLTRRDLIAKLQGLQLEISQLVRELEALPAPTSQPEQNMCTIHNVAWRKTKYGLGHPLDDGSGKWCNKATENYKKGVQRR